MTNDTSRSIGTTLTAIAAVSVIAFAACSKGKKAPEAAGTSETVPSKLETPIPSQPQAGKVDEKLTPIIADLVARFERHEGITAKVKTELAQAAGGPGSTTGDGIYDCKRQDGKLLINMWLPNAMNIFTGDKNLFSVEIIVDVYDGEFLYKRLQQHGLRRLVKRNYVHDGILQIGGQGLFGPMMQKNDLKLLPDATIDGKEMVVIEATPLSGGLKGKHYFDKQTGIRNKFAEADAAGVPKVTLELTEIKLNPEFAADAFSAKLPVGFEFVDETQPAGPNP
jgi:hypothetical protein